jgi:1,6-anhydro-N-acetylmuramate kinase
MSAARHSTPRSVRLVVGCMSGTSMDAIDAALVRIEGAGLAMKARLVHASTGTLRPLDHSMRPLARRGKATAEQFARIALMLGRAHVPVIRRALAGRAADLIVVHGQTICHAPPVTWQLLNPHPIAGAFGAPVVFDLRGADVQAGGQGAPITPLADWVLLRHRTERRVIVNLGGFANYTELPPQSRAAWSGVRGGDLCVCNQLLNAIAVRFLGEPFDRGGRAALSGSVIAPLLRRLLARLARQAAAGLSLGTGDELLDILPARASGPDLAATACSAIGSTLARSLRRADRLILAGGGAMNRALVRQITRDFPGSVALSDDLGVPKRYREAMEMAVLGALCQDRVPITLPAVTHRPPGPLISGCWILP